MPSQPRKPAEAPLRRLGALAKLPVFLDLAGKRAVMAGGSAAVAWKAELLAAAGAHVHVYAEELGPEMAALLVRGAAAGTLTHHPRSWTGDCFSGAAIAVADAETMEAAQAFFCAAGAAGVPVNVIDKPEFCQFQFGSIVNRSPVVIGISTDGGAPILGQTIRRRIEALLPPALAIWGRLAKDVRETVSARLNPGLQRRRFWETFAERAFGSVPNGDTRETLDELIAATAADATTARGRVTLVGAGPGDAELLTMRAVRALQSADVILFDDLVSNDILELARREAKRLLVGKRGHRASCRQEDINALAIDLARQGNHVVRLKSGDPMIFGRAGEEVGAIEAAGIEVAVVPGITAALAMASALGVSLTHRDCAQSVRFVTGHAHHGALPVDLDWQGLAHPATTLIFYMASKTASQISSRLLAAGMLPGTPAVVISNASRPDQVRWTGTLSRLEEGAAIGWPGAPTLIGIGRVFAPSNCRSLSLASSS